MKKLKSKKDIQDSGMGQVKKTEFWDDTLYFGLFLWIVINDFFLIVGVIASYKSTTIQHIFETYQFILAIQVAFSFMIVSIWKHNILPKLRFKHDNKQEKSRKRSR